MSCKADCFIDTECNHKCIRPIDAPNRLAWQYYNVLGKPPGELAARQFEVCGCGCGNLIATPPCNVMSDRLPK